MKVGSVPAFLGELGDEVGERGEDGVVLCCVLCPCRNDIVCCFESLGIFGSWSGPKNS